MAIFLSKSTPTEGTVSGSTAAHPPANYWVISAVSTKWTDYDIVLAVPAGDKKYWKNDSNVPVVMTAPEKAVVDAAELVVNKAIRDKEVIDKDEELRMAGFEYDDGVLTNTFAAGEQSQLYALAFKHSSSDFSFPLDIATVTGETYSLTNANKNAFKTAMNSFIRGIEATGVAIRASIEAAVDQAALDAIIDAR